MLEKKPKKTKQKTTTTEADVSGLDGYPILREAVVE